jgi:hypothetical protein
MSREQDAQVAEFLGWRRIEWEGGTTPFGRSPQNVLSLVLQEVPHYSSRIEDAWLIVEYLRDLWTKATDGVSGFDNSFPAPFHDAHFFDRLHRHADRRWPWAFLYVTPQAIVDAFLAMKENE